MTAKRLNLPRAVLSLILVSMICLSPDRQSLADVMNVTLEANTYEIIARPDSSVRIVMEGFSRIKTPGAPPLPTQEFLIALPPDAEVNSIEVRGENETELYAQYRIEPVPVQDSMNSPQVDSLARELWRRNYDCIYGQDDWYPENAGRAGGQGSIQEFRFVRVTFYPFSVRPQSGRLLFRPTANVKIEYDRGRPEPARSHQPSDLRKAQPRLAEMFVNYSYMYRSYFPLPPGDISYDFLVTSADVILLVQHLFAEDVPTWLELSGDINCDGAITSGDLIHLTAYIFKGGLSPREVCVAK